MLIDFYFKMQAKQNLKTLKALLKKLTLRMPANVKVSRKRSHVEQALVFLRNAGVLQGFPCITGFLKQRMGLFNAKSP